MPRFRLFPIAGNKVSGPCVEVECDNEALALLEAEERVSNSFGIEVWQGPRLVCRLPALAERASV